jgi:hypothetical protein
MINLNIIRLTAEYTESAEDIGLGVWRFRGLANELNH